MIYLDSAATTLEKPEAVARAMGRAVTTMASPGRGGSEATRRAEDTAFACRSEAAELLGVGDPARVVFTMNATHGLNIAIRTVVQPGMTVAVTGYEHNAVTRPLHAIPGVKLAVLDGPLYRPEAMVEELDEALDSGVDAVVMTQVSNVFGYAMPVEEMAARCRKKGVPFIVDASQGAGVVPIRADAWGAAFVAMPGHKGLYGPQGTGLLLCGAEARPLLYGGTGSRSRDQRMPEELPDRLEAGTHNMPGIAGLLEGIRFVRRTGTDKIAAHEKRMARQAAEALGQIDGVRVFRRDDFSCQTGVVSFIPEGYDCQEVADALGRRGIAVRAGLHCAPLAHRTAGTLDTGTVRISVSAFTKPEHIVRFADALQGVLCEKVTN